MVADDVAVSYAELDGRSNRLARVLAGFGVGPESVVALAVGRSVELITALLAVLKAGAAYLPVDPSYPGGADRVHARVMRGRRGHRGDRGECGGACRGGRCRRAGAG